jgi:hypothetical protein
MRQHVSYRRWLWRERALAYVFPVWLAFVLGLILYFNAWVPHFRKVAATPQLNQNSQLYTGSIVIVPTRGDHCWQRMMDNRTGQLWDIGYVKCADVVTDLVEKRQRGAISNSRMRAIGKIFRHDGK